MGASYRVTGTLMRTHRGLVLEVDGGGTYALDVGRSARELVGRRVTVEGKRAGFDLLDVERIALAG